MKEHKNGSVLPKGKFVDIGQGHTMHYHEASDGPVVVFVHGSGPGASGYSNFKQNFGYFADHGYRVLVPDSLGYGYSSKPEDAKYTLDFLVDALARFLRAQGVTSCALVGNSLGGAMAIRLALTQPKLVNRLVLMAPGGLEEREVYMGMRGIRRMLKAIFSGQEITRESMRMVFELQLYDPAAVTDQTIEERFAIAQTQPKTVFSTSEVPNQVEQLGDLSCPILAFWGMNDQFCPPSGAISISQRCKNTRVMTLSECGHWVMVEHTDLFNKLSVEFLDEGN